MPGKLTFNRFRCLTIALMALIALLAVVGTFLDSSIDTRRGISAQAAGGALILEIQSPSWRPRQYPGNTWAMSLQTPSLRWRPRIARSHGATIIELPAFLPLALLGLTLIAARQAHRRLLSTKHCSQCHYPLAHLIAVGDPLRKHGWALQCPECGWSVPAPPQAVYDAIVRSRRRSHAIATTRTPPRTG